MAYNDFMQMNPEVNLQAEIADLEKKLAEKRATLSSDGGSRHDKEVLREVVAEHFLEEGKEKSYVGATGSDSDDDDDPTPAIYPKNPNVLKEVAKPSYEDPAIKQKVQDLVVVAFSDGIGKAVAKAKNANDAAVIDAFHDVLVDELYDHMVREGKLPKIQ